MSKPPLILDGKVTAAAIKADLTKRVEELKKKGVALGLGTLLVGDDAGSQKYVAGKHKDCSEVGIESIRYDLPETATQEEVIEIIEKMNNDPTCTAFIVQLPLPEHLDANVIIDRVDPAKDADGMHPYNLGKLVLHTDGITGVPMPCTPRGILELLDDYGIDLTGKDVCVLGRGITIGRTMGMLLTTRGVDATVTLCHSRTQNIEEKIAAADVVIAAMGQAYFVKPEMIKDGVVLVDVGVSRIYDEEAGRWRVRGDIDPSCYEKCSAYSPNPGGVGPMTRAMLLRNVVDAAERMSQRV